MKLEQRSGKTYAIGSPVGDAWLTSPFGPRQPIQVRNSAGTLLYTTNDFHFGADLQAALGTPIEEIPPDGGMAFQYDDDARDGSGLVVRLQHNGYRTEYFHTKLGGWRPPNGFKVEQGWTFAEVGMTGATTGPHLHLALRKDGQAFQRTGAAGTHYTSDHIDPFGEEGLTFFNGPLIKEWTNLELRKAAATAVARGEYETELRADGKWWMVVETKLT